MNRLILGGNGFDLYLGLKTGYKDLLAKVLYGLINNLNPLDKNIFIKVNENIKLSYKKKTDDFFDELLKLIKDNKVEIKTELLKECLNQIERYNWCDYETIAHNLEIKGELNEYVFNLLNYTFINELTSIDFNNKGDFNKIDKINKIIDILKSEGIKDTFICNFNYTDTFREVADKMGLNTDKNLINIHGSLKEDGYNCIFGYGYLKDGAAWDGKPPSNIIKGNKILPSESKGCRYDKVKNFMNLNEFEVLIVGCSCGKSDREYLGEIFNHENCKSIKIMYHGGKNYDEIKENILSCRIDEMLISEKEEKFNF